MFSTKKYLSSENKAELQECGYTVVPGILDEETCDKYMDQYKTWLSKFTENGTWPMNYESLIQRYSIAHYEPSWNVRMKTRPVFAEIWGTDKLMSSLDAVAIGRPPEDGEENFAVDDDSMHWLHTDQESMRRGLHAYQGALYLEAADEDDWTFEVLKNSHLLHGQFFNEHPKATIRSNSTGIYHLRDDRDVEWFQIRGCPRERVTVSKGGFLLWDARLIHANARPKKGRQNPGRWRYMVLVCMAPAIWAGKEDINVAETAYNELCMTQHWPTQGAAFLKNTLPSDYKNLFATDTLPEIAKTEEAKRLCGVLAYNYHDGKPNGPKWMPKWIGLEYKDKLFKSYHNCAMNIITVLIFAASVAVWFGYFA